MRGSDALGKEVAVLFMLCYFSVNRFSDLIRIRMDDVTFMRNGNIGVFMAKSKTDKECAGLDFEISVLQMMGEFSVPGMLKEYMKELRMKKADYSFPKPQGAMRTNTRRYLSYALAYKGVDDVYILVNKSK